jgi:hypothetical protein
VTALGAVTESRPRLEVTPAGPKARLLRTAGSAEVLVRLEVNNPTDDAIRVEGIRVAYLRGGKVLREKPSGDQPRIEGSPDRGRVVRPGQRERWDGLCLDGVPEGADRVRLGLDLSAARGMTRVRSSQDVIVEFEASEKPPTLQLPFRGYWLVTQGHRCRTNHRVGGFGGEFAWDFARIGPDGHSVRDTYESSRRNADTFSFGEAVLAPAPGRVIRFVNDVPDNEERTEYPRRSLLDDLKRPDWVFGNYLILEIDSGAYVLLAHLQEGSIILKPGDRVEAGSQVARVGNSGNSVRPHLHIQVMDRSDPADPEVTGLPAQFAGFTEVTVRGRGSRRDILARRVGAGDPPERSIVTEASLEDWNR